ncbi:YidH family protein [Microbacterium sp. A93]|uniref:YidH family protein n=1 Tax=unclassified Microbacterium TaxID=2609290 RepID=UPI003F442D1E
MSPRERFPAAVYRHGAEPDARFTFANERTFLAWTRTALALVAAGVALELLGLDLQPTLKLAASLVLIGTGIVTPALAWVGWIRSERALRLGNPLPASLLAPLAGLAVTLSGVLILIATLV